MPVNIKMVLESMEECGSEGLEELLEKEKNGFLKVPGRNEDMYFALFK